MHSISRDAHIYIIYQTTAKQINHFFIFFELSIRANDEVQFKTRLLEVL